MLVCLLVGTIYKVNKMNLTSLRVAANIGRRRLSTNAGPGSGVGGSEGKLFVKFKVHNNYLDDFLSLS